MSWLPYIISSALFAIVLLAVEKIILSLGLCSNLRKELKQITSELSGMP